MTLALLFALGCKDSDGDGVRDGRDCAPVDPAVSPDVRETCNGRDDDCDGQIDEEVAVVAFFDADGDGFGDSELARRVCALPPDGATVGGDCDDLDPTVAPGADELCDERDNDCDAEVDEGVLRTFFQDLDGDGHGTSAAVVTGCLAPPGFADTDDDCDDTDAIAWSNAPESCDDHDNDCDGAADEDLLQVRVWVDTDGDGAGNPDEPAVACGPLDGLSDDPRDCDDADPAVGPDAVDLQGDGIDTDCDGWTDEFGVPSIFATVEEALAVAPTGAVVQFDEGTFDVSIDLTGHDVILAGEGCAYTTLRGLVGTSVVIADQGTITDLTLTGGSGTPSLALDGDTEGGGLLVFGTVLGENLCVTDNAASKRGGGISIATGTLTLRDSVVSRNESDRNGGGIYVGVGATLDGTRVVLRDNAAWEGDGGGVRIEGGTARLTHVALVANIGENGGGLKVDDIPDGDETVGEGIADLHFTSFHANSAYADSGQGQAIYNDSATLIAVDSTFTQHAVEGTVVQSFAASEARFERVGFAGNAGRDVDEAWRQDALRTHDPRFVRTDGPPSSWDLRWLPDAPWADAGDPAQADLDGSPAGIGAFSGPDTWPDVLAGLGDEDGDGIAEALEQHFALNPVVDDAGLDPDADGLVNRDEVLFDADPWIADTDADGWTDNLEVGAGTDPSRSADHRPMPDAGPDRIAAIGEPVPLDAAASWDPDGESLALTWTLVPPPGSSAVVLAPTATATSFVPDIAGTYVVTLEGSDGAAADVDIVTVTAVLATIVPDQAPTLAEAVALAPAGTGVALRPGTWTGTVDIDSRSLALFGLGKPEEVVLDGLGAGPIAATDGAGALTVAHLTMRNGQGVLGGCVQSLDTTVLTLLDVVFEDCQAAVQGGAVYSSGSDLVARDVVTRRSYAGEGGGLFHAFGTLDVVGWVSDGDVADDRGAGFALSEVTPGTDRSLQQVVVHAARARNATAIDHHAITATTDLVIRNAAFLGNHGGTVLFSGGGPSSVLSTVFLDNDVDALLDGAGKWFVGGTVEDGNAGVVVGTLVTTDPTPWLLAGRPALASSVHDHDLGADRLAAVATSPGRVAAVDAGFADDTDPDHSPADVGPWAGPVARHGVRYAADVDADGMDDGWEVAAGLDPGDAADATSDVDADDLDALAEFALGTLPNRADSDLDGVPDLDEVLAGSNPADERDHRPQPDANGPWVGEILVAASLDGSASVDPNGDPLTYQWTLDAVPVGSTLQPDDLLGEASAVASIQPDSAGLFRVGLTVSDGAATSAVQWLPVVVAAPVSVPGDYPDLASAIAAAVDGSTISVGPGDWPVAIPTGLKEVVIVGAGTDATRLLGLVGDPILNVGNGDAVTLRALTLTGGDGDNGGAIVCLNGTLTLTDVVAERNLSRDGGALHSDTCTLTFTDLSLLENDAWKAGGGAWIRGGTLTWTRGLVAGNLARGSGGGIAFVGELAATMTNVHFHDNVAESSGGAMHQTYNGLITEAPDIVLDHVAVTRNAGTSGAVYAAYGTLAVHESAFVDNEAHGLYVYTAATGTGTSNAFYGNEIGAAFPLTLGLTAPDAILVDPDLVDLDAGDVHLLPSSALRDAGGGTDLDGTPSDVGVHGGPFAATDFDAFYGDHDGDGLPDGWEGWMGLDPAVFDAPADADGDGLNTLAEGLWLTDPFDADSDLDGVSDGVEVLAGDDPADPVDHAPAVDVGGDRAADPDDPVTVSASGSDPDGGGLSWSWTLAEKPGRSLRDSADISGATSASPTFTPDTAGRFVLRATVSAGGGVTVADVVIATSGDVLVPEDYLDVATALDAAVDGAAVRVGAGSFTLHHEAAGRAVHLVGAGRDLTTLDGDGFAVLRAVDGESVTLENLTFTGGFASGGALEVQGGLLTTHGVAFANNHGVVAGGLSVETSDWVGDDNHIVDNLSSRYGGGAYVLTDTVADLVHVVMAGNEAVNFTGGGVYIWNASLFLSNAIVHGNSGTTGGAFYVLADSGETALADLEYVTSTYNTATLNNGAFAQTAGGSLVLQRSIVAFEQGVSAIYSPTGTFYGEELLFWDSGKPLDDVEDVYAPEIEADPLLADVDEVDWSDDDWSLLPGSPALAAGIGADDEAVDLGAYGGPNGSW